MAADYRNRSPIAEAASDYEHRDYRIYSAMGAGHYYPGLEHDVGSRIAAKHGEKMLAGTSDALKSRSHARYIGAATGFAAKYNKHKAFLISRNPR